MACMLKVGTYAPTTGMDSEGKMLRGLANAQFRQTASIFNDKTSDIIWCVPRIIPQGPANCFLNEKFIFMTKGEGIMEQACFIGFSAPA